MKLHGIHHITAITSDAQKNLDFYSKLLGLRLVKTTVNFDDPQSYHLYYGDELGRPGSVLTFFAWPGARRGVIGSSQVLVTSFAIPEGSLSYWSKRLTDAKVVTYPVATGKGLGFVDPDGMRLEIMERTEFGEFTPWAKSEIPVGHALRGFAGAALSSLRLPQTKELLTTVLGAQGSAESLSFEDDAVKAAIKLDASKVESGRLGAGIVHHIAFRVPNDTEHQAWLKLLAQRGYHTSSVMDRSYFHSLYFREPSGVLFEFATDKPGFTIDESVETLGESLRLPPWMEDSRPLITQLLPRIHVAQGLTLP